MKTFINVLYRKILYKIPLKFLLLILVIVGVLYYNYSSAETGNILKSNNTRALPTVVNLPSSNWYNLENYFYDGLFDYQIDTLNGYYEVHIDNSVLFTCIGRYDKNNSSQYSLDGTTWYNAWNNDIGCFDNKTIYVQGGTVKFFYFFEGDGFIPNKLTSLQCQTEYSLIPVSSVDQNYCTTNNLCPSCPVCPPSGGSGWSNVYINDILHIGAPNIVMNIAEEIDWDYEYTAGGNNMNIDIVGYNVDYDKIDSIVDNQSYKPSSEDFANILGILAPYTKIIVFFVFLFLVWAWIKKPFKSKKL